MKQKMENYEGLPCNQPNALGPAGEFIPTRVASWERKSESESSERESKNASVHPTSPPDERDNEGNSREIHLLHALRVSSCSLGFPPLARFISSPSIESCLSKFFYLVAEIWEPNFSYNFDPPRDRTQKRNRPGLVRLEWHKSRTPISFVRETLFPKYSNTNVLYGSGCDGKRFISIEYC